MRDVFLRVVNHLQFFSELSRESDGTLDIFEEGNRSLRMMLVIVVLVRDGACRLVACQVLLDQEQASFAGALNDL